MERVMSVEEKIRRAEEIYERRRMGEERPVTKVTINEKKDIKLFKKMIIQILVSIAIYLVIYAVQNNQYVFSEDLINKTNEILSYDTNFIEIYNNIKEKIMSYFSKEDEVQQEETNKENEAIGGAEEDIKEEVDSDSNEVISEEDAEEVKQELTQEEIDIKNIKETTTFIKPVKGTISSKFGQRDSATGSVPKNHTGTDIAAPTGTIIKSSTEGEVVLASDKGDYGNHLKIQIGEVSIIYAHCSKLYVKQGDKISQGQEIAEVGSTGNSTGPHLHFEIRISERCIDPQSILEL